MSCKETAVTDVVITVRNNFYSVDFEAAGHFWSSSEDFLSNSKQCAYNLCECLFMVSLIRTHSCFTHSARASSYSFPTVLSVQWIMGFHASVATSQLILYRKKKCSSKPCRKFGPKQNHISCTGAVWDVCVAPRPHTDQTTNEQTHTERLKWGCSYYNNTKKENTDFKA